MNLQRSAVGFSFFTLFVLLAIAVSSAAVIAGYSVNEVAMGSATTFYSIVLPFFIFNLVVTLGLKRNFKWAFVLALIEVLILLCWGFYKLITAFEFFFALVFLSMLSTLVYDYVKSQDDAHEQCEED
ncbi:hypothetical protein [Pleionea litopenaei]|uniref:Uncharacterized protein n=1 Tax=Pleionea litopenaei TaxID=3070815 RepID=A0AA51RQG4_9GAMM|nr:hypothetical protein [Pleionea sp. HL-JVS1]WMS85648.1 hypothetical protein Q9312_10525 [Pleionea sp. HL-JVS1]